ncbi:hypothetical protein ACQP3C_29265, partial [Escherichia coli]
RRTISCFNLITFIEFLTGRKSSQHRSTNSPSKQKYLIHRKIKPEKLSTSIYNKTEVSGQEVKQNGKKNLKVLKMVLG